MKAIKKAEEICRRSNISLTPLRKRVLNIIYGEGKSSIKAYDLLAKLRCEYPSARPVTVYRALDFLMENGFIHKIQGKNSFVACNHPHDSHNCGFLICEKCDSVTEYCNEGMWDNISSYLMNGNFQANNIVLEIYGLCESCR